MCYSKGMEDPNKTITEGRQLTYDDLPKNVGEEVEGVAYIVKWGLTNPCSMVGRFKNTGSGIYFVHSKGSAYGFFGPNGYALSEEEARRRIGELRDRRVKSLQKQVAKLQKLDPSKVQFPRTDD